MKQGLSYGRITWSFEDGFDPSVPCVPSPIFRFNPIRINGKEKCPEFSDKVALRLLRKTGNRRIGFREAYREWYHRSSWVDRDLGEGRAFLRWIERESVAVRISPQDFTLHRYFTTPGAPAHEHSDELGRELSFALSPVEVNARRVKLYLQDDAVLNLLSLPFGYEEDFLKLVRRYVEKRFDWECWKAPAPLFLDWVKSEARRPVFLPGQLGLCLPLT
jgi:hypothetical protein